jgi:glucosamine--fructose-6-phosphate aminotransferase (isomerizing)
MMVIGTGHDKHLQELSRYYLSIPESSWLGNPVLESIPAQLISYHMAVHLGRDVDQPRNLAKSVTVE